MFGRPLCILQFQRQSQGIDVIIGIVAPPWFPAILSTGFDRCARESQGFGVSEASPRTDKE